jgi:hypothetical protein
MPTINPMGSTAPENQFKPGILRDPLEIFFTIVPPINSLKGDIPLQLQFTFLTQNRPDWAKYMLKAAKRPPISYPIRWR